MCAAAAREGPSDVEQKPSDLKNEQANPKKKTKHKKRRKTAADAEATLTPEEHERRERQRQRQQEVMQVKPPFDCTAAHSGCRTTVAEVPVAPLSVVQFAYRWVRARQGVPSMCRAGSCAGQGSTSNFEAQARRAECCAEQLIGGRAHCQAEHE